MIETYFRALFVGASVDWTKVKVEACARIIFCENYLVNVIIAKDEDHMQEWSSHRNGPGTEIDGSWSDTMKVQRRCIDELLLLALQ